MILTRKIAIEDMYKHGIVINATKKAIKELEPPALCPCIKCGITHPWRECPEFVSYPKSYI